MEIQMKDLSHGCYSSDLVTYAGIIRYRRRFCHGINVNDPQDLRALKESQQMQMQIRNVYYNHRHK